MIFLVFILRIIHSECVFFLCRGYIAPELKDRTAVSFKSDIYSLGVTITEILTGEKETCDTEKVIKHV